MAGGTADGSIQVWNYKKAFSSKADFIFKSPAPSNESTVLSASADTLSTSSQGSIRKVYEGPGMGFSGSGSSSLNKGFMAFATPSSKTLAVKEAKSSSASVAVSLRGHGDDISVTCVVIAKDNLTMVSRGTDGKVIIWSLRFGGTNQSVPIRVFSDLLNVYPTANVEFSPDCTILCCGTSAPLDRGNANAVVSGNASSTTVSSSTNRDNKCYLVFFEVKDPVASTSSTSQGTSSSEPLMRISVPNVTSIINVKWNANTNQLFCRYL